MKHNKEYTAAAVQRYARMLNQYGVSGYWHEFTLSMTSNEYQIKVKSPLTGRLLTWAFGKIK